MSRSTKHSGWKNVGLTWLGRKPEGRTLAFMVPRRRCGRLMLVAAASSAQSCDKCSHRLLREINTEEIGRSLICIGKAVGHGEPSFLRIAVCRERNARYNSSPTVRRRGVRRRDQVPSARKFLFRKLYEVWASRRRASQSRVRLAAIPVAHYVLPVMFYSAKGCRGWADWNEKPGENGPGRVV